MINSGAQTAQLIEFVNGTGSVVQIRFHTATK